MLMREPSISVNFAIPHWHEVQDKEDYQTHIGNRAQPALQIKLNNLLPSPTLDFDQSFRHERV